MEPQIPRAIFHLNNSKEPNTCCYTMSLNPHGKPPIKTLQMKTFIRQSKWQLRIPTLFQELLASIIKVAQLQFLCSLK